MANETKDDDDEVMLEDRIAKEALSHYHFTLHKTKGKPKPMYEWTIYAAIVAVSKKQDKLWVVSCATGSKCTSLSSSHQNNNHNIGWILHDGHAEILARRGLQRILWQHLQSTTTKTTMIDYGNGDNIPLLLEEEKGDDRRETTWKWNPDITLHLYISDSPCGDASIFPYKDENDNNNIIHFTGAKVILPTATTATSHADTEKKDNDKNNNENLVVLWENNCQQNDTSFCLGREMMKQEVGKLRVKSGRSNIQSQNRSTSMSCSDKLCRYQIFGYQGTLLQYYIRQPIRMTSIIVSAHPNSSPKKQEEALYRAIPQRIQTTLNFLSTSTTTTSDDDDIVFSDTIIPKVAVVSAIFVQGKSMMEHQRQQQKETNDDGKKRRKLNSTSSCGIAFNWQCTCKDKLEIIVGAKGTRQGKKNGTWNQMEQSIPSRISRWELFKLARPFLKHINEQERVNPDDGKDKDEKTCDSYQNYKRQLRPSFVTKLQNLIFLSEYSPLCGWIRNTQQGDFRLVTKHEMLS